MRQIANRIKEGAKDMGQVIMWSGEGSFCHSIALTAEFGVGYLLLLLLLVCYR